MYISDCEQIFPVAVFYIVGIWVMLYNGQMRLWVYLCDLYLNGPRLHTQKEREKGDWCYVSPQASGVTGTRGHRCLISSRGLT